MNQYPNQYPPPNQPYGTPQPGFGPGYAPAGFPMPHPGMPTAEDESNLNVLSICHFIYGGFFALGGLVGIVYVVIGVFLAAGSMGAAGGTGGPPPAAIGGIVAMFGGIISLVIWVMAALVIYSGFSLRKRRRRTLSFVMACLCCLNIPLGTALGVFTLIVLSKPGVKAIYDRVAYYGA
ncbi:MAG TPA: hypothetical protein VGG39_35265 [Polyangiaceae bacterium]